jgi:hypothetical protein
MEGKKHSAEFIYAKKLVYVEKYEVNEVNISVDQNSQGEQTHSANIIFCKGNDRKVIQSSKDDFVLFAWSLKTTIRDGITKIIEIKNPNKYYDNIHHFIAKSKDEVEQAKVEILTGEKRLSNCFSSEAALENVLNGKYDSSVVRELVENYVYAIANEILTIAFLKKNFDKLRKKSDDPTKFTELFNLAGSVYQKHLFSFPPLKAIEIYSRISKIDLDHTSKSLLHQHRSSHEKWKGLTQNATISVDGRIAAKNLLDDYSDYYELVRKMLRHLAFIVSHSDMSSFQDSQEGIEQALTKKGYGDLLESVKRLFRNSGSHWEADYSEKGKIKLVDTRSGTAKIVGEIGYQKLIDNHHLIRELSSSLLISILVTERLLYLRALDSPDLKFRLVENMH